MIIIVLGELKAPSVQQVPSITIVVLCCVMFVWGSVIWLQWIFGDSNRNDRHQNWMYCRFSIIASIILIILQSLQLFSLRNAVKNKRRYKSHHPATFELWPEFTRAYPKGEETQR